MTASNHTPGPWRVAPQSDYAGDDINIDASTRGYVACAGKVGISNGEAEANARLIAAAPDLLDMLAAAAARIEVAAAEGNTILSAWLPDARAAIARARGDGGATK